MSKLALRTYPEATETIWENSRWNDAAPVFSIAIPTYRDNAAPLLRTLSACQNANEVEIIVFDDGSDDEDLFRILEIVAVVSPAAVRLVRAAKNQGRSVARNRLIEHARTNWILLLDADMSPDSIGFLSRYLNEIQNNNSPRLIVGGFSLESAPKDKAFALHRWQSEASECLPASVRNTHPGRYVFTSNVMAHRSLLTDISFDEQFSGWGWEDVDWGLRAAALSTVVHIDNTATHLGLDTAETLMRKYGRSGENFALVLAKHPEALANTPLVRAARLLQKLPARKLLKALAKKLAVTDADFLPIGLRGRALKLWRALVYAEALS